MYRINISVCLIISGSFSRGHALIPESTFFSKIYEMTLKFSPYLAQSQIFAPVENDYKGYPLALSP